jgi:uncharacterized membrane protein
MNKLRLESFSDCVISILITIMVLNFQVPHGATWDALRPLLPIFVPYVLSFIFLGIYWNNHHHMMQTVAHVNGGILWANLHLLFWLSLVPFVTGWVGQTGFAQLPIAVYGFVLLMTAGAYRILEKFIIASQGKHSKLASAVGNAFKERMSMVLCFIAIPVSYYNTLISFVLYAAVAAMWIVPDRRIERKLKE